MKQVWKYHLPHTRNLINMPRSGQIISVQKQGNHGVLWAIVDTEPTHDTEERQIGIFGTGHNLPDNICVHLGTYQDGEFVWHAFELWP